MIVCNWFFTISKIQFYILFLILVATQPLTAQVTVTNVLENQVGNSRIGEENRTGFYDQLNIRNIQNNIYMGIKLETYGSSTDSLEGYTALSQKYIEYRTNQVRLRVGNFYNIFGNGIAMRSFDLPGLILEDFRTRSRYSPFRDLDGLMLQFNNSEYEINLIKGTPVESTSSPEFPDTSRRRGSVEGAELNYKDIEMLDFGASYIHIIPEQGDDNEVYSFSVRLNSEWLHSIIAIEDLFIDIEAEYSIRDRDLFSEGFSISNNDPHALFLAFSLDYGKFSFITEYKDYIGYNLGINDPPSLVKEHTHPLLNRDTHVLIPKNEKGIQFEGNYFFGESSTLTINVSSAKNDIFLNETNFYERFTEFSHKINSDLKGSFYFAHSKDEFNAISSRTTFGVTADYIINERIGSSFEVAFQNATRDFEYYLDKNDSSRFFTPTDFSSTFLSASVGISQILNFGIVAERSTDPDETDLPSTFEIETDPKWWPSVNLSFDAGSANEFRVFLGDRRGGTACTAGTCYELLPFKGLEIRLISRF